MLEYGSTIVLVAGGHVTPLAQDTLRERRVTVVADGADVDAGGAGAGGRHPHRGASPAITRRWRSRRAHRRSTCAAAAWRRTTSAPTTSDPVDYPDTAAAAARAGGARRGRRRRSSSTAPASGRHRRQQGGRRAGRDVHQRDAGALRAAAQRRQRAGPRLHAADARPRRWRSSTCSSTRRCARRATSAGSPRSASSRRGPGQLMAAADLQRLIQIIVEEVAAAAGRGRAGPLRLPRRAVRVLPRPAARRDRGRRDAARACTPSGGAAGGVAAMIDHTLLKPDATRDGHRGAVPRGGGIRVRQRLREPDLGGRPARGCCRARARQGLLGGRLSAGRDDAGHEALRDAAGDLRRRARDRHGDQRRRAQVRRPAAGRARHRGGDRRRAARPAPSARSSSRRRC